MTGQPRIIPPEEARKWHLFVTGHAIPGGFPDGVPSTNDLAHTAAVLGEQRQAVLALHTHGPLQGHDFEVCDVCTDEDGYWETYPCPTARALGVME